MVAALRAKRASVRGDKATVPNKAHGAETGPRSNSLDCLADAALAAGSDEEAAAPRHMRNAKRNAGLRMSAQAAAAKLPMAQLAGLYGELHLWHWNDFFVSIPDWIPKAASVSHLSDWYHLYLGL